MRRVVVTLMLVLLGCKPPNVPISPPTRYVVDFETGDLSQATSVRSCESAATCSMASIEIVNSPVRRGAHAARFSSDATDPALLGHNHRAEVTVGPPTLGEWWYRISTYVETNWGDDDATCLDCPAKSHYHILTDFHHQNECNLSDPAMQPLQLNVHDSKIQWEGFSGLQSEAKTTQTVFWAADLDPLKGRYVDWVVHARWSVDPNVGYLEIWKDGLSIVKYQGRTAHPLGCNVYWIAGITYDVHETRSVVLDELQMSTASSGSSFVSP